MDNFYLKICEQPIKWKKEPKIPLYTSQKENLDLNWNDFENLYRQCYEQEQSSNVTNLIKNSQDFELNTNVNRLIRTNNQSSWSEIIENQNIQKINDDQKDQQEEYHQKPVLKRSNTSFRTHNKSFTQLISENEKLKRYRNNKRSVKTLSMMSLKRSLFTPILKNNFKYGFKEVQIKYLNSEYSKMIIVDENILVCELIVLAIQEFQRTSKCDQNLLKYSNFSLAYKLTSFDDFFDLCNSQADSVIEDKTQQYQEFPYVIDEENSFSSKKIDLDLGQKIFYKVLNLEVVDKIRYGIDLYTIEITKQQFPNSIILLVEDTKNEIFYNLNNRLDATLEDIYNQLQRRSGNKYNKNDWYFNLKFPCINIDYKEPLHFQFPLHLLPIHWLQISFKFDNIHNTAAGSIRELYNQSGVKDSFIISQSLTDMNCQIEKKLEMFNYKEFKVIKLENDGYQNEVVIGIDYFDFYFSYLTTKNSKFSLYKLAKCFVQIVLENHQSGQTKDYKRIPTSSILSILLQDNQKIEIKYQKNEDKVKKLKFILPKRDESEEEPKKKDEKIININEIVQKLSYIIEQRRISPTQRIN
ncbi:unnamed protein product (macronuclear) [Paramecium tetraurelia]|uniref:Ubiquitin-like protease family profile domain-containing protein n=1 Tax=Paramecium tetraurelia TaxID=5888 RepID=A0D925_PARTE|nr:uncharacterized protein GSPATT00014488001 [Paramecium tetraurelia]CAK79542.1 unnamed protein product [Paramecium tetraurelia]|eukprot:XP_001446939.1 hypothetical protein (macronuclear) [Paramecium tetraurelia strain d4-2]